MREWRAKNPEKARENNRKSAAKYELKHRNRVMFRRARRRAAKFGIPFNIDYDDVVIPKTCPALGIPIIVGGRLSDNSPSLDRINPNSGYVKGNVAVICNRANRIKSDGSPAEHRAIADWIEKNKL